MYNLKLFPYIMGSESAKALSELLGAKRVRDIGRYTPKSGQTIINWGNGREPSWAGVANSKRVKILNSPNAVNLAGNKLSTFRTLKAAGIPTPEFTTDITVAKTWLNDNERVVERHNLRGSSGEGIRIVSLDDEDTEGELTSAPLYTKYVNKSTEYRVHIFQGQLIDFVQKKRVSSERRDDNFNPYVASMERGWIFTRTDVPEVPSAVRVAKNAVTALGLDFGAVDIMFYEGRPYVLEVNTAPGLAGTTLVKYGNALRRLMGFGDLSEAETRQILEPATVTQSTRLVAAVSASANRRTIEPVTPTRRSRDDEKIILRLRVTRANAAKLRALLATLG
jgi:predicted ATP-grasp superfamily ATP-dependent carboligase